MRILTLSSVFPNPRQPLLGVFVRERMRHVAHRAGVRVLAPVPWSPLDPLARVLKPGFRPARPGPGAGGDPPAEHPGFLCLPGVAKGVDGFLYYRSLVRRVERLRREYPFDLIDAHFAYPDGTAAALLARRLGVPFTVTLRGTEVPYSRSAVKRVQMRWALGRAAAVIAVSASLARVAEGLGCDPRKIRVVPNGVDAQRFRPRDRALARKELGLPEDGRVLLSVGGMVPRKGHHRVVALMPRLLERFADLRYVVVGGGTVEGDITEEVRSRVRELGLEERVRLEGPRPPDRLPLYYSAADVFVLATGNEGWANVFLESMACGTPVVTTDVGGNREVVCSEALGTVVPPGDPEALYRALCGALSRDWDREALVAHARERSWDRVAEEVLDVFSRVLSGTPAEGDGGSVRAAAP